MNIVLRVIIDLFIVGGCFFAFAGAVGIVRMPDTFSRMQSSTNITTLGILLTLVANPVGGHAVARAAYRIGVRPKRELVVDDLADPEACVEPEAPAEVEKEGDEA